MKAPKNNRIAEGWGEQLQEWLAHGSYRDFAHLFRLRMAEEKESFHSLLDVGCGTGRLLRYCCDRGIPCVGIDMSMTIVKYHKETTGLPVILGDVMNIPVKDSRFDLVVCFGLIEHVPDPTAALRELRRVTPQTAYSHKRAVTLGYLPTVGANMVFHGWTISTWVARNGRADV